MLQTGEPSRRGAYGLTLTGLLSGHPALPLADERWPEWDWRISPAATRSRLVKPLWESMDFEGDARLGLCRRDRICVLTVDLAPSLDALMHPWLTTLAGLHAHGEGRATLHAGGVVVDGQVWAILGDRGRGKTSTLAWAAQRGYGITADDLVVMDGFHALSGPACLDLRPGAASYFGVGGSQEIMPGRVRSRLLLPPEAPSLPIGGFVLPSWGDTLILDRVHPQLIAETLEAHSYTSPVRPFSLLRYAVLPMLSWRRPQAYEELEPTTRRLFEELHALSS